MKKVKINSQGQNPTNENMFRTKKFKLMVRDQIQTMKVFWRLKLTFTQKTLEKEFEKYIGLFSFFGERKKYSCFTE